MGLKKDRNEYLRGATPEQKKQIRAATKASQQGVLNAQINMAKSMGLQKLPKQAKADPSANVIHRTGEPFVDAVALSKMTPAQQWRELKKANPYLAANFYARNTKAVDDEIDGK